MSSFRGYSFFCFILNFEVFINILWAFLSRNVITKITHRFLFIVFLFLLLLLLFFFQFIDLNVLLRHGVSFVEKF